MNIKFLKCFKNILRPNRLSAPTCSVDFQRLRCGDRFLYETVTLWTKLDGETARKHSDQSQALGTEGYGYNGDTICTFDRHEQVTFIPPNVEIVNLFH